MTHLDGGALFRSHAAFVAGFLTGLGVERGSLDDAVQEVFLIAHRRGGFVEGEAQPTTWLAAIALRVASGLRRSRRRRLKGEAIEPPSQADHRTPLAAALAAEMLRRTQRALDDLGLEHRAVFILYEIEGESCESIARGLNVPIGTVYSRLHVARERFQKAQARFEAEERAVMRGHARREAV